MNHWIAWLKKHKPWTWVFSGIGVALIGWFLTWWLSEPESQSQKITAHGGGVVAKGNISVGPGSFVAGRDIRDVTVHSYSGISEERFQALSEELGITKAALKSFLKILERKAVPPEDLDSTLRKIAGRYKALEEKLAKFTSDDPEVKALKKAAKEALEQGDFERVEVLLNKASAKDIEAAITMQEVAKRRLLSAAASFVTVFEVSLGGYRGAPPHSRQAKKNLVIRTS